VLIDYQKHDISGTLGTGAPESIFNIPVEIREFDKWSTERGQVDAGQEDNEMQSVGFHLRYGKDLRAGVCCILSTVVSLHGWFKIEG
jgi:hypothetical protein